MKFKDLQADLKNFQKYHAPPLPPPLPEICETCGKHHGDFKIDWVVVQHVLEGGRGDMDYVLEVPCKEHLPSVIVD